MSKPIGRLYWNSKGVSGYVVVNGYALKFAAEQANSGTTWIYQSKKQEEEEFEALQKAVKKDEIVEHLQDVEASIEA